MTKQELVASLADIPDDELLFLVRGSSFAAPETLREYARRILHFERILPNRTLATAKKARSEADAAFVLADRMDAAHTEAREAERLAGLTANEENERLMAEHERLVREAKKRQLEAANAVLRSALGEPEPDR